MPHTIVVLISVFQIFDDDPETEYKLEKKKTNGEGAEPDRNLQQKLCDEAAAHITNLLKRLQSGEIDFSSPEKNNLAANEQLMQVEYLCRNEASILYAEVPCYQRVVEDSDIQVILT